MIRLESGCEEETRELGARLAGMLSPNSTILLHGDLGSGKTVFCQGVASGLGLGQQLVQSPTFTLVHDYAAGEVRMLHVDLYRLERAEVEAAGILEVLMEPGVKVVEWAERLPWRPSEAVVVAITRCGESRSIEISAGSSGLDLDLLGE